MASVTNQAYLKDNPSMNTVTISRVRTLLLFSTLAALAVLASPSWFPEVEAAARRAEETKIIRSARSGRWSAATTWEGGKVPGAGARVQVRTGHTVVYDIKSIKAIRMIHVAGKLSFAPDRDTRLDVGLLKVQPGDDASEDGFDCDAHVSDSDSTQPRAALEVGTPTRPVEAKHTALIRLVYFDGMDAQSLPAIVCCDGHMDFHGAPLSRSWVKLGATADKGASRATLAQKVTGWRPGDRVIVTATEGTALPDTRRPGPRAQKVYTEERKIKSVDGAGLTLDKPLAHVHLGTGHYRGEVANLSRNVIVESADPATARGHTMYHVGSSGSISYAEFRHLGKEGVLGKYSIHYHLAGDSMRGSYVQGASIWDSGNRWLTIHGTSYLVVRDCVGYQSVGHGFFLEDGTEVFNVLDRNLAVQAFEGKRLPKQALPFDQNEGAGFWWANSLNTFTGNVACECDRYGFRFEATPTSEFSPILSMRLADGKRRNVDIRTLPFVRFEGNESHCNGLYGFNLGEGVNRVGPDVKHPFVVRKMKIWEEHYAFRPQSPSVLVEDMRIFRAQYGVYHPNYDHHVYRRLYIGQTDEEPFNRGHDDDSVQYGPLTVDGLTFDGLNGNPVPMIQISDDNPDGKAVSHFRNVKVINRKDKAGDRRALVNLGGGPRPQPKTPKGVPVYIHDFYGKGRHAKVVSTRAKDLIKDGSKYKSDPPLTGDESRVAEVRNIAFPKLLDQVDDLPPATVITSATRSAGGKLLVRGTTSDNGKVKKVLVNGREAKALTANFAEWEVILEAKKTRRVKLTAYAEDAAGNVEKRPHVIVVK
jgi:hypothetical protein